MPSPLTGLSRRLAARGGLAHGTLRGPGLRGGGLRDALPLLRHPRFEVFPTASVEQTVLEWVPRDLTVTVTGSPGKGLDATLDLTERLSAAGYRVVPHLPARLVIDGAHLADVVARLTAQGVDDVFVPAGDLDPPAGRFDSALSLLVGLARIGQPFSRIGITGYPQSHPRIDDDVTIQAMWDKRRYATYIVSNICLDAAILRRWIARVRRRGVTLPLFVGLAGPVDRARLVTMAAKAGVAESARFLAGHGEWLIRLGLPYGYSPDRLLARASATLASPAAAVEGLHLFTFNQVRQTEQWRRSLVDRLDGSSSD
jgi:methylenetetrahydrofolate reductase (NADH)